MKIPFIDLKAQYNALKTDIDERIHRVLEHGQFIMGPEVKECEEELKKFIGSKHAIVCSNGTIALQMALMAMGIGPGDEVITTSFSFIATAEVLLLIGAIPVFVDIDPYTYNINPENIEAAITSKTKAILPVSLFGQPADMDEINRIAKKHNLCVIEDAAQSFGAPYKNRRSGNLSDIGCTSFFPAKPLGVYGDGGAIFTNDSTLAEKLLSIRMHGMGVHRYQHSRIGLNGRLDSIQCAILMAKLPRYTWEVERRDFIAARYTQAFSELSSYGLRTPKIATERSSVWAQYTLWVPDRSSFQNKLQGKGVPTAIHYPMAMPDQDAYKGIGRLQNIQNARAAAEHVISLPVYPDMSTEIQNYVIEAVRSVYI